MDVDIMATILKCILIFTHYLYVLDVGFVLYSGREETGL